MPGRRPLPFGHLGDGNIHFNISQPVGADKAAFLARWDEVNAVVHGVVALRRLDLGRARHRRLKRDLLPAGQGSRSSSTLMRAIKAMLDPNGIMNPGKVL